jgi:PKD repeat protein
VQNETVVTFTAAAAATTPAVQFQRYEWDFGDGTSATTSGATTTHIYRSSGFKTATVTAVAVDGRTASASAAVNVVPPTPIGVNVGSSPASPVDVGDVVSFTATVTGETDIRQYRWDFGDGTVVTTSGNQTTHIYRSPGRRTVTVIVTAADGRTATGRTEVQVTEQPD